MHYHVYLQQFTGIIHTHTHKDTRIFFQLEEIQDEVRDGSFFSLHDHEPYVEAADTKTSQRRKAGGESFKLR